MGIEKRIFRFWLGLSISSLFFAACNRGSSSSFYTFRNAPVGMLALPNGDLLALGNYLRNMEGGTDSHTTAYNRTFLYRSTDGGTSWTKDLDVEGQSADALSLLDGSIILNGMSNFVQQLGSDHVTLTTIGQVLDSLDTDPSTAPNEFTPTKIVKTTDGSYFLACYMNPASIGTWRTYKSTDAMTSWQRVDQYYYDPAAADVQVGSSPADIAVDSSDNLYVVGAASVVQGRTHWIVRKSTDRGSTWRNVDEFFYDTGDGRQHSAKANGISIDASNNIYVVGKADHTWQSRSVVRKSSDGGASWSTVHEYPTTFTPYESNPSGNGWGIGIDSRQRVYVLAGRSLDSATGISGWHVVFRSADGGASWATLDDYSYSGTDSFAWASAFAEAPNGNLYVQGEVLSDSRSNQAWDVTYHWYVRKSSDDGATWASVHDVGFNE